MKIFTWKQRFQTWGLTWFNIIFFSGIGYLIDAAVGKGRLFFVIGLILSFPVNALLIRKVMLDDYARKQQKK